MEERGISSVKPFVLPLFARAAFDALLDAAVKALSVPCGTASKVGGAAAL